MGLFDSDGQEDSTAEAAPELPGYLQAAALHSIANGQGDIADSSTWSIGNAPKFVFSALTRAATSAYNVIPAVERMTHLDTEASYVDTGDVLRGFDDDLGQYYTRNKDTIDKVGDIVGMFAPGMVGVKTLNYAQKALELLPEGKAGLNLARSIGTLPSKADQYAERASAAIADNPYIKINTDMMKSFAAGFGQSALEGAAFQTAASVAMQDYSPLFSEQSPRDILFNAVTGGGLLGLGTVGVASAARTWYAVKKAAVAADLESQSFTHITEPESGAPAYATLMSRVVDKNGNNIATAGKYTRQAERKAQTLSTLIRDSVNSLIPNAKNETALGNVFSDIVSGLDNVGATRHLTYLQEIGRAGEDLKMERLSNIAEDIGMEDGTSITYLKVWGDSAGDVLHTPPKTLNLGDIYKDRQAVQGFINKCGFKIDKIWNSAQETDHNVAEARQIWARQFDASAFESQLIGSHDLPLLQQAYLSGVKTLTIQFPDKTRTGILSSSDLLDHIKQAQSDVALDLLTNPEVPEQLSTEHIAKMIGVKTSYLEGQVSEKNQIGDLFVNANIPTDQLYMPRTIKMGYKIPEGAALNPNADIAAMTHLSELNAIQSQTHENVFGNYLGGHLGIKDITIPKLDPLDIEKATRFGTGQSTVTAVSGNYGSPAENAAYSGQQVHQLRQAVDKKIVTNIGPSINDLKADPQASAELLNIHQRVRQSADKYVLSESADGTTALVNANNPGNIIPIEHRRTFTFLNAWIAHNNSILTQRYNMLAGSGFKFTDMRGKLYFPAPDPKKFTHHAFVVDDSITGTGHVSMIWAKSPDELSALANQVPTGAGLKVIFKRDTENYFKAHQMYDYDLGINENYVDTAMKRRGISASYFPAQDIEALSNEMLNWRVQRDHALLRDMVTMRNSKYFAELYRKGGEFTAIGTSQANPFSLRQFAESGVRNPYVDIVRTALDIPNNVNVPLWSALNNFAENAFSGVAKTVGAIFSSQKATPDKFTEVEKTLEEAGFSNPYKAAVLSLSENHPAGRGPLSTFASRANGILSFLMLRSDPMNALNNGIGHQVLLWSETRDLVSKILAKDATAAGQLAIRIPGTQKQMLAPGKLIANAYRNYFGSFMADSPNKELKALYTSQGWITSISDQVKAAMNDLSLTGNESAGRLHEMAIAAAKKIEAISGNHIVEEMNRFVSANVAHQLVEMAGMDAKSALSYINTFVNRTNGVYLASQRPLLFSGPLGKAIGLFQTYQFNMMAHIFRRLQTGNSKQLAYLLGMQSTIYGMNGLPAFNAINQHIVGNAFGNSKHNDIINTAYDMTGKEAGDWLMYGLSSNMLLDPALKINLYTRGDINPRQATIVPTDFKDIPVVATASNVIKTFVNSVNKISQGAPVGEVFLQGLEHAQLSRPLAGLAAVLEGHSTTTKGTIVAENDFHSLATLARLAGARPLDEAIARDAYYRVQAYSGAEQTRIQNLAQAVRNKVTSGENVSDEDIQDFLARYVDAGGDQKHFNKFWQHQVLGAQKTQVDQLVHGAGRGFSQYMQSLLGGSELYTSPGE